jgi:hypothetical protein
LTADLINQKDRRQGYQAFLYSPYANLTERIELTFFDPFNLLTASLPLSISLLKKAETAGILVEIEMK